MFDDDFCNCFPFNHKYQTARVQFIDRVQILGLLFLAMASLISQLALHNIVSGGRFWSTAYLLHFSFGAVVVFLTAVKGSPNSISGLRHTHVSKYIYTHAHTHIL